jgi:hypothetical protein
MDVGTLYTIATYVSGFFDFVTCVAVIVVALTVVRRADATASYVLAGVMGVRFLASCCTRGLGQVRSGGEALEMVSGGLAIIRPFFDLALWGAVIFVLVQLAKKASPPSA